MWNVCEGVKSVRSVRLCDFVFDCECVTVY